MLKRCVLLMFAVGMICSSSAEAQLLKGRFRRNQPQKLSAPAESVRAPGAITEVVRTSDGQVIAKADDSDIQVIGSIGTHDGRTLETTGIGKSIYIDESNLPKNFSSARHGSEYPHIVIGGERLDYDFKSKFYRYAGTNDRAMFLSYASKDVAVYKLMTPTRRDPQTGKEQIRTPIVTWVNLPPNLPGSNFAP